MLVQQVVLCLATVRLTCDVVKGIGSSTCEFHGRSIAVDRSCLIRTSLHTLTSPPSPPSIWWKRTARPFCRHWLHLASQQLDLEIAHRARALGRQTQVYELSSLLASCEGNPGDSRSFDGGNTMARRSTAHSLSTQTVVSSAPTSI